MFTGIVEEIGEVRNVERRGDVMRLDLAARVAVEGSEVGASVAVNGVCLTVVTTRAGSLAFEVGPETLERTTLGRVKAGDPVNLERPLRFGGTGTERQSRTRWRRSSALGGCDISMCNVAPWWMTTVDSELRTSSMKRDGSLDWYSPKIRRRAAPVSTSRDRARVMPT